MAVPAPLDNREAVEEGTKDLLKEIDALVGTPIGGDRTILRRMEDTLMDGYARALALDAEKLRLERRMRAVAGASGDAAEKNRELKMLARGITAAEAERVRLRAVLSVLRARTTAVRGAA